MRDRSAMRRTAWREVWPALVLLLVSACVVAIAASDGPRASSPWLTLGLLPAALFTGLAVGRSTPRTLAFLLARPCRREQLLLARFTVAMVSLGIAWTIAMAVILARDFGAVRLLEGGFAAGLLVLAVVCGAIGSTVTDRESLGLGIGTLVFFTVPLVPLLGTEALDITLGRTIAAYPFTLALLLAGSIIGFGRAVFLAWREQLPMRDRWTARAMVTRCAGAWAMMQAICVVVVWSSASPARATPLVVVGADERGPIVLGGSPPSFDEATGRRVDSVRIGTDEPTVVFDTSRRSVLLGGHPAGDVARAIFGGGHVAVAVRDRDHGGCRIAVGDAVEQGLRWLDLAVAWGCPTLSLSPTGSSLAVFSQYDLFVVDVATGVPRQLYAKGYAPHVLGWAGEQPVWWHPVAFDKMSVFRGATRIATVEASRARLSPDGERLAFGKSITVPRINRQPPGQLVNVSVLTLRDGAVRKLYEDRVRLEIVGWLDRDHVAIDDDRPTPAVLTIVHADTGRIVASVPHEGALPPSHIAGPLHGPWIVTRFGVQVEAWGTDGTLLWQEHTARLDLDNLEVRRWAIFEGEVIGIDAQGNWWRHPVPWEVTP